MLHNRDCELRKAGIALTCTRLPQHITAQNACPARSGYITGLLVMQARCSSALDALQDGSCKQNDSLNERFGTIAAVHMAISRHPASSMRHARHHVPRRTQ
jgi:hypothetical protein